MRVVVPVLSLGILAVAAPGLQAAITCNAANSTFSVFNVDTPTADAYKIQINYWNPNATGDLCLDVNTGAGTFTMTTAPNALATTQGPPTAYPSIFKGCHWQGNGTCTAGSVMPPSAVPNPNDPNSFPKLVSTITSLPSTWSIISTPGTWDASYDIWFDIDGDARTLGQNDGAEIMVWMNHSTTYLAAPSRQPDAGNGFIQPSGHRRAAAITIPGLPGTWDIWTSRLNNAGAGNTQWNVISYVKADGGVDAMNFDGNILIKDAMTRSCPMDAANQDNLGRACLQSTWYLTSVQAGFEPWSGGTGLATTSFKAFATNGATVTQDGRTTDDGRPIVFWGSPFSIVAPGCPGGTATYTVNLVDLSTGTRTVAVDSNGAQVLNRPMALGAAGRFTATQAALAPSHGDAEVVINRSCGSITVPIFIDPSGQVLNRADRKPIPGAKVTLLYSTSNTDAGPFVAAPNHNQGLVADVMSPRNTFNPDFTSSLGAFGWDVATGIYRVRAEKAGCGSTETPNLHVNLITGAITGLELLLDCAGSSTGVAVKVDTYTDWGAGYCAFVTVTNNTSSRVRWQVRFNAEGNIYNAWNFNYTKVGNLVSAVRGVGWNDFLDPRESTHSMGFCANR